MLAQTDLLEARLDAVTFDGCDLRGADLRGGRLRRCELRRCELRRCALDGLVGVEALRGAALEWPAIVEHAGLWAGVLGIDVLG